MAYTVPFVDARPAGGWLANTPAFVSADPGAGAERIVEKIVLSNFDGSGHTVDIWIGGTSDVNRITDQISVPANDCVVLDEIYVLGNGVQMAAQADVSNQVAIAVHGAVHTDSGSITPVVTPLQFFQGFLDDGGGDPTVWASPDGLTTGVIHGITLVNIDAYPRDIFFSLDGSTARAHFHVVLAAGDRKQFPGPFIVNPSTTIYGLSDVAGVVAAMVSGAIFVN
jgi:hypothetical protein